MDICQKFLGSMNKMINDVLILEQKVVLNRGFRDITNNDIRILDAIGVEQPKSMSVVAKKMSVTVGTLTIAINNLVKKGYVLRVRNAEDRRVVLLSLSAKGIDVYKANMEFRREMITAVTKDFDEEQCGVLERALMNLHAFYKERN